ncbi:MAG: ribonuclease III [Candidatus Komeilibacteria bacterium CG_4_10_14_0_2_um_filter_37_10]|uniref:Ribonuclease 3 n=1 Tax=Candidatus Komeilibacteria bacterium CG_4_10_14_0_2_um_filter_37_10 TaxID=1974470 RepID=A0A2M7VD28_9BACT|nr:MAG: ribonuclease III [Candidatus Komeilibacteria bacterium CG_4_10_14_0_2_um_filter_37_10]PJA92562.1 MAG: ribonuclease III [Candidatus Komeilibacteria bacterium CG_4_9_14_3_um_filter_37_5]
MKDFKKLADGWEVKFNNPELLKQAHVHRSYLNEHKDFGMEHNERLEFLGDAVLELAVTKFLYNNYPNPEGELTNWRASLVNGQMLASIAKGLKIEDNLYLSKGESQDKNGKARNYILANALEACIGSIYLDQGFEAAEKFIEKFVLVKLPEILQARAFIDPKSHFQERSQEVYGSTPAYKVLEEKGPDHEKFFRVGLYIGKRKISEGTGMSKQEAQIDAARAGLVAMSW